MNSTKLIPMPSSLLNGTASSILFVNKQLFPIELDIFIKLVYSILALAGLLGNGVIFYLFGSKRVSLTAFNILLLNLSISDALADLSIWPYIFLDLKTVRGFEQETANVLCSVTRGQFIYWMVTTASIFTLSVMSLIRYFVIKYPLKAQFFKRKYALLIVILIVWPVSIAMAIPNFISWRYDYVDATCYRDWPQGISDQYYTLFTGLFGFVIPIVVLIFTFVATRRYLRSSNKRSRAQNVSSLKRSKNASMVLCALVLAFVVCWSPFFTYWVLLRTAKSLFPDGKEGQYSRLRVILLAVLISLCNTVADPIIYGLRAEDFRKALIDMRDGIPYFASKKRIRARTARSNYAETRSDNIEQTHNQETPSHKNDPNV